MAKPGSSLCNLACDYCYYLSKAALPGGPGTGRMSDETLEAFIRQYIAASPDGHVVFSWQGGEPSLLGLSFFRKVLTFQRRHERPGLRIENDLQTNGTLLDDEWCEFLAANRFLVGLSIDGPPEIHDRHRRTRGDRGTAATVMETARRLQRHHVPFNTLTCVHRDNARRPLDIYKFLRDDVGSKRMQFIPIVEHRDFKCSAPATWSPTDLPRDGDPQSRPGHPDSIVTDWSVSPEDWGYFLRRLFDRWIANDSRRIFIAQFNSLVAVHCGLPAETCVSSEACGTCLAVEANGDLFACDHFVYPEYRRGNVRTHDLRGMVSSMEQRSFGFAKSHLLPRQCRECEHLGDCWGDCPKNRLLRTADGEPGLNYLCAGHRAFLSHAKPAIDRLIRERNLKFRLGRN